MNLAKINLWGGPHDGVMTPALYPIEKAPKYIELSSFYSPEGYEYGSKTIYRLYGQWKTFEPESYILIYKLKEYS